MGSSIAVGDAVNVAARLEQTASPGEILLGGETYRHARDAIRVEPVGRGRKGKNDARPGLGAFSISSRERLPSPATSTHLS